jgi:hypothetical protein
MTNFVVDRVAHLRRKWKVRLIGGGCIVLLQSKYLLIAIDKYRYIKVL